MHSSTTGWRRRAACRNYPLLDWHSNIPSEVTSCRTICASCEVRKDCLAEALLARDPWGVWGDLSPEERELIYGTEYLRILPPHGSNARYAKHRCRYRCCRTAHAKYEQQRRRRKPFASDP
ncbi:WhiB family transcriptional regulator [Amycolatopsis ultiminotia]|uniref:WhiB family transcriptional regulator n=1 Tax=Amycolatopsis ultiminotia TaxID=543629 RepID=UPI003CD081B2